MDVSIFVETTFDDGETKRRNFVRLHRAPDEFGSENLDLLLNDAMTLLRRLQEVIVQDQVGVDKTWGSCGAFSVCDGQPTIENCGPCDGYSVSPFGRPPHPSALSHAGIGNVID